MVDLSAYHLVVPLVELSVFLMVPQTADKKEFVKVDSMETAKGDLLVIYLGRIRVACWVYK